MVSLRPLLAATALVSALVSPAQADVGFSVSFSDSASPYASFESAIQTTLLAAAAAWSPYLAGNGVIDITVNFDPTLLSATGHSVTSGFVGNNGSYNLFEQGAAYELRTGIDPNGNAADAVITIGGSYLQNELFFDFGSGTLPADRTDALSVFMHELGHVFAFNGWRDDQTGALPGDYASSFDALIQFDGSHSFFTGANAMAQYGGPVPLTFANGMHLGNAGPGPGANLLPDLMNGVEFQRGTRYAISALDIAIFCDAGVAGSCEALTLAAVPEPAAPALMLAGLAALGWLRRRRSA